jgi:hypothetical protein
MVRKSSSFAPDLDVNEHAIRAGVRRVAPPTWIAQPDAGGVITVFIAEYAADFTFPANRTFNRAGNTCALDQ